MDVLRVAVTMVLSIVLPLLVQLFDRRRLRARGHDGPWNVASWGSALYAFGPLSMLGWSHLSRRRPWRWLMGPAWCAALALVLLGAGGQLDDMLLPGRGWDAFTDWALEWVLGYATAFAPGVVVLLLIDGGQALWRACFDKR